MSVIMSSAYLTVHLFGLITKEYDYKTYETQNQCVNSLEIYKSKFNDKDRYEVIFDKAAAYLKISDKSNYKIQIHYCGKITK